MRVNVDETKVVISGEWRKVGQTAGGWLCGVSGEGVGDDSIWCAGCRRWVHRCGGMWVACTEM